MERHGNQLGHTVPGTTYACAPGGPNDYVIVLAQPQMWKAMCGAMGRPELADDPRFAAADARWENRAVLDAILEELTRKATKHEVMRLLGSLQRFEVSEQVAWRAATLMREYRRSHTGIGLGDYLIAATALTEGLELATLKVRHYPMFPELARPF